MKTFEEWWSAYWVTPGVTVTKNAAQDAWKARDEIAKAEIKAAVEAEREECAKLCETAKGNQIWEMCGESCAEEIRARGE